MRKNLTEIVFILDRSGSMSGLEADTIGGFNSMIEKQKKENGEALISTVLFDNVSEVIHDRVPAQRVEPMTDRDYCICSPFPKASFHLFANPIFGFVIPCPKCPIHSTNNVAVGLSRKSGSIAGRYTYSCHSHCGLLYGGRRSFTLIFSFSTQLQECL